MFQYTARDSELSVFKADRGIMVVLNVEAVEAKEGFCGSSRVLIFYRSEEGGEEQTIIRCSPVVVKLVGFGEGVHEGREGGWVEVGGVVLEAVKAHKQVNYRRTSTRRKGEIHILLNSSSNFKSMNSEPEVAPLLTHISAISSSESWPMSL